MASLTQILQDHGSLLVLDASGESQSVWFESPGGPVRASRQPNEAGASLFHAIAATCRQPMLAGAFAYCEAPGSVMGIRIAAMAIRSWTALRPRPVYSYHALRLAVEGSAEKKAFLADARRGYWHFAVRGEPMRRLATADLESARGSLALTSLDGYRHWEPLPAGTGTEPYDVGALLLATSHLDLFQTSDAPDAVLSSSPSYVQWTPHIHQLP